MMIPYAFMRGGQCAPQHGAESQLADPSPVNETALPLSPLICPEEAVVDMGVPVTCLLYTSDAAD
ncbi:MAG: hypothetical protein N2423_09180, partial [Novosphingobium sp.]|nr:hypothetical protein [Novosphingobium sp.]